MILADNWMLKSLERLFNGVKKIEIVPYSSFLNVLVKIVSQSLKVDVILVPNQEQDIFYMP